MISKEVIHLSHWQDPVDAGPCASDGQDYPVELTGKTRPIPREDAPGSLHGGDVPPTEYVTIPDAFAGCSTRETGEPAPFGGGGSRAKPERHKMPKKKKSVPNT